MAESSVQRDFKLTKAEREKEIQAEAARNLAQEWPLPNNLSDLKSFAFGSRNLFSVLESGKRHGPASMDDRRSSGHSPAPLFFQLDFAG